LCALSTLVAAQGEIAAQDPSAKVNVLWRKAVSTDGSNQGTAYTMSNRIITARGRVFVAWLDHVADIVIQLLPIVRTAYPEQEMAWMGTLTFDQSGRLYIASVIQHPPFSWGAPSQEVILLTSDDRGKTFDVLAVSEPDPEMAHWFPSIERPFGPAPIGMPSLLYCHSRPRDRKTRICEPGEIWSARLGTRD